MVKVSDSDLFDVVKPLGSDALKKLFIALGLQFCQISKAEKSAATDDVDLQALAVLSSWKKANGSKATRIAILHALERCENVEAKEDLEELWKNKGINIYYIYTHIILC